MKLRKGGGSVSITSDILRGHTETIILSLLLKQDSYGYKINKEILARTDRRYELKEATLYSAFKRLEQAAVSGRIGETRPLEPGEDITRSQKKGEKPTLPTGGTGRRQRS